MNTDMNGSRLISNAVKLLHVPKRYCEDARQAGWLAYYSGQNVRSAISDFIQEERIYEALSCKPLPSHSVRGKTKPGSERYICGAELGVISVCDNERQSDRDEHEKLCHYASVLGRHSRWKDNRDARACANQHKLAEQKRIVLV